MVVVASALSDLSLAAHKLNFDPLPLALCEAADSLYGLSSLDIQSNTLQLAASQTRGEHAAPFVPLLLSAYLTCWSPLRKRTTSSLLKIY